MDMTNDPAKGAPNPQRPQMDGIVKALRFTSDFMGKLTADDMARIEGLGLDPDMLWMNLMAFALDGLGARPETTPSRKDQR